VQACITVVRVNLISVATMNLAPLRESLTVEESNNAIILTNVETRLSVLITFAEQVVPYAIEPMSILPDLRRIFQNVNKRTKSDVENDFQV